MQHEKRTPLPEPDPQSAAHSNRMEDYLRSKIAAAGGMISFAEFMHDALYAPGLGYYAAGAAKFGESGDFVTAPEISSLFGSVVARQVAEVLTAIDDPIILEMGAGSGRLAVDLLRTLERINALPAKYAILEVSADLRQRQENRIDRDLPHLADRIHWLSALPDEFNGVLIANELLDALAAERFSATQQGIDQVCVSERDGVFRWSARPASEPLLSAVRKIEQDIGAPFGDGFTSEVCLAIPALIDDISASLRRGAVFLFDYGVSRREYYRPDRSSGWLRCHFRHHAHDNPLILPGIQDLTTWVDFTAVADGAVSNGLSVLGYQNQSQFLLGGGLDEETQNMTDLSPEGQIQLSSEIQSLLLPGAMGENFKCIVLGAGDVPTPSCFQFADRTTSL